MKRLWSLKVVPLLVMHLIATVCHIEVTCIGFCYKGLFQIVFKYTSSLALVSLWPIALHYTNMHLKWPYEIVCVIFKYTHHSM